MWPDQDIPMNRACHIRPTQCSTKILTTTYILKDLYLQVEIISLCASSACRNGFNTRIPASTARKFISWWQLCAVFPDLPTAGATLNPRQFRKSQPQFLGHFLDKDGNWANPDKTPAIAKVSPLTNVSELWQFMGLVNQLADLTQPLRQILSKKSTWLWGPEQDLAVVNVRAELVKPTILTLYNLQAPIQVCVGASSYGLGVVLRQFEWRLVAYVSQSMTETEKRYAQVKKHWQQPGRVRSLHYIHWGWSSHRNWLQAACTPIGNKLSILTAYVPIWVLWF